MFGNRKRRRKEKRIMYFFFLCLDCNEKENEKKIYVSFYFYTHINGFYFFILWIYPYKCKKYIKVMGKYVTSCHIMLCMWVLLFKNHSLPSIPPNLGRLQRTKYFSNFSYIYIYIYFMNFENLTI